MSKHLNRASQRLPAPNTGKANSDAHMTKFFEDLSVLTKVLSKIAQGMHGNGLCVIKTVFYVNFITTDQ